MIQTEQFTVEIEAEDTKGAKAGAILYFNQGNYNETGNINVVIGDIKEIND